MSELLILTLMTLCGVTTPQGVAQLDSARNLYAEAYRLDIGSDSVSPDTIAANRLYLKAAEMGYAPAQNFIGFRYLKGEGMEPDADRGLYWLGEAAMGGDVRAASNLGYLLANGEYVEKDDAKALFWLRRAAEKDFAPALSQLGDFYRDGREVEPDPLQAARLYLKAAEKGLPDAASRLISLSGLHKTGFPVDITPEQRRAIINELPETFRTHPDLLSFIAGFYALGFGVPYSYDKSLQIYRLAADLGDDNALDILEELRGQFPDHPVLEGM